MRNTGWTKNPRSIRETWVWEDRYYRYYVDLVMEAATESMEYQFKKSFIPLERGQYVTTLRRLAKRWETGSTWVWTFLKDLQASHLILLQRLPRHMGGETQVGAWAGTLITILNYDQDQKLGARVTTRQSAAGNADERMEVRTDIEKVVVPFAHEQKAHPDTTKHSPPALGTPCQLTAILERLADITGQPAESWPHDQIAALSALVDGGFTWDDIQAGVEQEAHRKMQGGGPPPYSLRYYVQAVKRGGRGRPDPSAERRIAELVATIGKPIT